MRTSKAQELVDIELIKGESFVLSVVPELESGAPISLSNLSADMEIFNLDNKDTILKKIIGTKTDSLFQFKIESIDSEGWSGKLGYIVTIVAQNNDKSKSLGYITMRW